MARPAVVATSPGSYTFDGASDTTPITIVAGTKLQQIFVSMIGSSGVPTCTLDGNAADISFAQAFGADNPAMFGFYDPAVGADKDVVIGNGVGGQPTGVVYCGWSTVDAGTAWDNTGNSTVDELFADVGSTSDGMAVVGLVKNAEPTFTTPSELIGTITDTVFSDDHAMGNEDGTGSTVRIEWTGANEDFHRIFMNLRAGEDAGKSVAICRRRQGY